MTTKSAGNSKLMYSAMLGVVSIAAGFLWYMYKQKLKDKPKKKKDNRDDVTRSNSVSNVTVMLTQPSDEGKVVTVLHKNDDGLIQPAADETKELSKIAEENTKAEDVPCHRLSESGVEMDENECDVLGVCDDELPLQQQVQVSDLCHSVSTVPCDSAVCNTEDTSDSDDSNTHITSDNAPPTSSSDVTPSPDIAQCTDLSDACDKSSSAQSELDDRLESECVIESTSWSETAAECECEQEASISAPAENGTCDCPDVVAVDQEAEASDNVTSSQVSIEAHLQSIAPVESEVVDEELRPETTSSDSGVSEQSDLVRKNKRNFPKYLGH